MAGKNAAPMALLAILFLLFPMTASAQSTAAHAAPGQLFVLSDRCLACHNDLITPSGQNVSIGTDWQSSAMAHSSKDPYWQASVRRETIDHPEAAAEIQDECSACHMPMARYKAKVQGQKGEVLAHLPILPARGRMGMLAADAVSCSMCHQIEAQDLGTESSFNAGFVVDTRTPLGQRRVYGPYKVDPGRKATMQSAAQVIPTESRHIQESALCGSCHTLYTHTRGPGGAKIGQLPEQMPYLEWLHSGYRDERSCQSCHMPRLEHPMAISAILPKEQQNFSPHTFRGGNFLLPLMLNRYRAELGVGELPQDLVITAEGTKRKLRQESALLRIGKIQTSGDALRIPLTLTNLTGHKLPTAYPSRRAWIHLKVSDARGHNLFESGALLPDGSIRSNDNDIDPRRYEPHYQQIDHPEQVQIYEAIMEDAEGQVTTGLISALRYTKDNRILPRGFDKNTVPEDIAVRGEARDDDDFEGEGDQILYLADVTGGERPFTVLAELWYQPIAFRWAHNLASYPAKEPQKFVRYYESMSGESATLLVREERSVE